MGKNLIYIGVVLVIVGGIWTLLENIGYKNPLDLKFESGNTGMIPGKLSILFIPKKINKLLLKDLCSY